MSNSATLSRAQLIYGLCLPLAALVGFFLAAPMRFGAVTILMSIGSVLIWPLFVRWYHPILVGSLHSVFVLAFLPGALPLWVPIALAAFFFVVFQRCLDSRIQFFPPGGVGWSLIAIALVVVFTALIRGGIGVSSLGSSTMGGKKYVFVLLGIAVFFVLATRPVARQHALFYVALLCLSSFTTILSHLVYLAGSKFYWMYRFIDSLPAVGQATAEWDVEGQMTFRSVPLMNTASALIGFMLASFGVSGMLHLRKPWRILLVAAFILVGMFGGFRSFIVSIGLLLTIAFFLEGLHRTRWMPVLFALVLVSIGVVATFSDKLPASVQRSLSFLPIKIDERVRMDAQGSVQWRLEMWELLRKEIPDYLIVGKGFAIDPTAFQMAGFNAHRGFTIQAEWAVLAGEYHNGPLSVLIPFGIGGALTFGWFLIATFRRMRSFCRSGDTALLTINRALFAMFIAKVIWFTFFFGSFHSEMVEFVALIGLAECLNATPNSEEKTELAWSDTAGIGEGESV